MDEETIRQDTDSVTVGGLWSTVNRRTVLKSALGVAAGPVVLSLSCASSDTLSRKERPVRFGVVTDCHYADVDPAGTRFYRQSLDKLGECVDRMNAEKVDFLIELGDFKDQGRPPVERDTLAYLEEVEAVFRRFDGPTYHVLGNHDVDSISKPQSLAHVTNTGVDRTRSYYSFDVKGLHCVVLDANYRSDGADYDRGNFDWTDANIPADELDWLRRDLATARGPAVVFIHQLLDGTGAVYVKNATEVRDVLERSGKVLAVFQGHHHAGDYNEINGIHYYTLVATVEGQGAENNSYAIVEVCSNLDAIVTGYRRAACKTLTLARPTEQRV
ncbi:metallophosphoesterase family protein [Anaerobaca lacustris]|uniref:Metallophosphoesterase n=1 Tax=Anaerobaca lacustris TaxID=3044600 RepID=A0AAW6U008_9BACT|nr:metallophosphoesterase [Sedimentisphaerales bacterium M17dextr]